MHGHEVDDERNRFLLTMLDDEEHGRLQPVEHYVAVFPDLGPFVRSEYAALVSPTASADPLAHIARTDSPRFVGRYEVLGRLSDGGMAVVLEARDPRLDRRVVLKTPHAAAVGDPKAKERLVREAKVLSSLDHPNLLKIIDVVEADEATFLVMPLHEGRTLASWIAMARTATGDAMAPNLVRLGDAPDRGEALRRLLSFLETTAKALHFAHEAGVVHRDVKPENLLVLPNGAPMVLDFGLALPDDDVRLTNAGELLGTPMYMAPEQIEGAPVTRATDVYALGVVAYEALTLVHPFAGSGGRGGVFRRVLAGDPVPVRKHAPHVARDLEAVVMRAMDREPDRRYPTAAAFAADLRRVLDLEPTEARAVTAFGLAWRRLRRQPRIAVVGIAAIASMIAAVVMTTLFLQLRTRFQERQRDLENALSASDPAVKNWYIDEGLSRALSGPRIVPLYPRGAVRNVDHLTWLGFPETDPQSPTKRSIHRYRVAVLGANGNELLVKEHEQVDAAGFCDLAIGPLAGAKPTEWRIDLLGYTDETGSWWPTTPVEAERYRVAARFDVVSSPPISAAPDSGGWRELMAAGFAAEVLRCCLAKVDDPGVGSVVALEFAREAANRLNDSALAAAIGSEISKRRG